MIGKTTKGNSIGGLLRYLLQSHGQNGEKRELVQVIGGTVVGGYTEMKATYDVLLDRKTVKNLIVNHSLRVGDDETVDRAKWINIATDLARGMGWEHYTIVQHSAHEIHIAAIRIDANGKTISDSQDFKRSEILARKLEKEYGLKQLESSHLLDMEGALQKPVAPTSRQLKQFERTGEVNHKYKLAKIFEEILKRKPTTTQFIDALETEYEIGVTVNVASTGTVSGIKFTIDGKTYKGSDVHAKFSWANLLKKGLTYDKNRDFERCRATLVDRQTSDDIKNERGNTDDISNGRANIERTSADDMCAGNFDAADRQQSGTGWETTKGYKRGFVQDDTMARTLEQVAKSNDSGHQKAGINTDKTRADNQVSDVRSESKLSISRRIADSAVQDYVKALPSPTYDVTIMRRGQSDIKTEKRSYTAKQLVDAVPFLMVRNKAGAEVICRPDDSRYLMLDDMNKSGVDYLKSQKIEPALVVETSPNNLQAWYNFGEVMSDETQRGMLKALSAKLENAGYSCDKAALTVERGGKLPGFTNRKPSREFEKNGVLQAPYVKLTEAVGRVVTRADEMLKKVKDWMIGQAIKGILAESKAEVVARRVEQLKPLQAFFDAKQTQYASSDQSSTDASVVNAALVAGYSPSDIAAVLADSRPDKPNPSYYAKMTVAKAQSFLAKQAQQAQEQGTEPEPKGK